LVSAARTSLAAACATNGRSSGAARRIASRMMTPVSPIADAPNLLGDLRRDAGTRGIEPDHARAALHQARERLPPHLAEQNLGGIGELGGRHGADGFHHRCPSAWPPGKVRRSFATSAACLRLAVKDWARM
jgi:hypothetical protein